MSPTDIPGRGGDRGDHGVGSHKQSFLASSPLAEESLLRDLEDEEEEEVNGIPDVHGASLGRTVSRGGDYSMVGSYRRTSAVAGGPRPLFPHPPEASRYISELDRDAALHDERSLLRDNEIIPPKHPRRESTASAKSNFLARKMSISTFIPRRQASVAVDAEAVDDTVDEDTPLIRDATLPYGGEDTPENIDRKWDDAVASGKIQTTWQREAKTLVQYSRPLIATFALQFSLSITSVFTVGHIGKTELGAVSLGSMSANISGFAFFIGLATSLDTLCAQAYGSGHKKLVGLQLQRMVFFLWIVSIPVAVLWSFGPQVLKKVLKEQEVAEKAGQYLRVMIFGLPGYAAFESGKRYVQAQGLFNATLYVLLFVAPLNILMHWIFVWQLEFGYIGAPMSVVISYNLLPICLFLYVRFIDGMECWPGFSKRAFKNWGPMVMLALPGLIMVLAEFLAFEFLTLSSSYISSTHLAAQSILGTISAITYAIPLPISIAASTRIANLIGATLVEPAKMATKVALWGAVIVGTFNAVLLILVRNYVPFLFTNDRDVAELTAKVLPINAAFQLFDALAALANGVLRGLGRQEIGGYVNIVCYYIIAIPLSVALGFGLHLDLYGLWAGPAIALGLVAGVEGYFIYKMDWHKAVDAAKARNSMG